MVQWSQTATEYDLFECKEKNSSHVSGLGFARDTSGSPSVVILEARQGKALSSLI